MSAFDWSTFTDSVHGAGVPVDQLLAAGFNATVVEDASFGDDNASVGSLVDIELNEHLDEQIYKASDFNRNPATNEHVRVFAQDGTGSLIGPWQREPGVAMEQCPVVFLGSEGVIAVLAPNLASFAYLLLSGTHIYAWSIGEKMRFESLKPSATDVLAPGFDAEKARAAFAEARALTPAFEALMQSLASA